MSEPSKKNLLQGLNEWLPVLSALGVPVAGAWGLVAALWRSAAGTVSERLLLVLSAAAFSVIVACGWWIWKQHVKIRRLHRSLSGPFKVSDDYSFNGDEGYWVDKTTGMRVCSRCILPPTKIISPLFETLGLNRICNEVPVWRCSNCGAEYLRRMDNLSL
jgi:predicted outer membrane lipoprotein